MISYKPKLGVSLVPHHELSTDVYHAVLWGIGAEFEIGAQVKVQYEWNEIVFGRL
jgi:hypothetical protein